jgi:hypothetical protein
MYSLVLLTAAEVTRDYYAEIPLGKKEEAAT